MPITYDYQEPPHSLARVKDTEATISLTVICYTCPVCGQECFPTEEALAEHMKSAHPLQWHFWYAPYGKPLLGASIVTGVGLAIIGLSKAFPPPLKPLKS